MTPSESKMMAVLVLGCGDVGSAIAHRLFTFGASVVLCDLPHPTHSRRGMAFTDALFEGAATLDGVVARRVDGLADIEAAWRAREFVPVVTLAEDELASSLEFQAVVDAIMRRHEPPPDRRGMARISVGLGPGYTPGLNCDIAVETQWGERMGSVLRDTSPQPLGGGPKLLDGVGRERFGAAPASGTWRTDAHIGSAVRAGDMIGRVGEADVRAPIAGTLRGLARDGVQVATGHRLLEVDPRPAPEIFGIGERPAAIARGVGRALGYE